MAKLAFILRNAAGVGQTGLVVQIKDDGGNVVASTTADTVTDVGTGGYVTTADLDPGVYSVYTGAGAGTIVPELAEIQHVDADEVPSALPVPVAEGGTGATTASGGRTNLGLVIGTNVQAYSGYLAGWVTYFEFWLTGTAAARKFASFLNSGITLHTVAEMQTLLDVALSGHDHEGDYAELAPSGALKLVEISDALPTAAEAYIGQIYARSTVTSYGVYICVRHDVGSYKWMALSAEPVGGGTAEQLEYTWAGGS